jgi:hypothetical protein
MATIQELHRTMPEILISARFNIAPASYFISKSLYKSNVPRYYKDIKSFIDGGGNINEKVNGKTLLHVAVENNVPSIYKFLIDQGADPSICTDLDYSLSKDWIPYKAKCITSDMFISYRIKTIEEKSFVSPSKKKLLNDWKSIQDGTYSIPSEEAMLESSEELSASNEGNGNSPNQVPLLSKKGGKRNTRNRRSKRKTRKVK